jgi:hypothetical protein
VNGNYDYQNALPQTDEEIEFQKHLDDENIPVPAWLERYFRLYFLRGMTFAGKKYTARLKQKMGKINP